MSHDDYMREQMYRMMMEDQRRSMDQAAYFQGTYMNRAAMPPPMEPPKPAPPPKPKPATPDLAILARALFETDESVLAHVRIRAESPERMPRTMQIAWDLNVGMLRSKAQERAAEMLKVWTGLPNGVVPKDGEA